MPPAEGALLPWAWAGKLKAHLADRETEVEVERLLIVTKLAPDTKTPSISLRRQRAIAHGDTATLGCHGWPAARARGQMANL